MNDFRPVTSPSVRRCADCDAPILPPKRGYKVGVIGFWRLICAACWCAPRYPDLRVWLDNRAYRAEEA